ncbi:hypothetical protein [Aidingimonas lacisalsi]|uniref:hypothetical protein n=1 Tax=Aidingimonas lacisalsi TaxID=2604086 RepID=UPI00191C03D0|nr:hypothetical protein [Aidingimonas lacisalsi]
MHQTTRHETGQENVIVRVLQASCTHAHALSDESGNLDYDIEPAILNAIGPPALFAEDMAEFTTETADRVRRYPAKTTHGTRSRI